MRKLIRYDGRNIWFGFGRSLIAFATLSELLFTPLAALFHPVAFVYGPICRPGMEFLSMYCLGGNAGLTVKNGIIIVTLLTVVIGWRPRWTAIPHLYATSSVTTAMTLPDGGDNIALIVLVLLTPIALIDSRRWVWAGPNARMRIESRELALYRSGRSDCRCSMFIQIVRLPRWVWATGRTVRPFTTLYVTRCLVLQGLANRSGTSFRTTRSASWRSLGVLLS